MEKFLKMKEESIFLIDIDRIIEEKAGKKAKYIPGLFRRYLKHIVHQKELNQFLIETKDKVGVEFLEACMGYLDVKIEVTGKENLPKDGCYTFVSNHPLGGVDGVALGYILGSFYDGNVRYLVNDLLMNLHGLAPLCIPINKTGKQSKDFPKIVEQGFQSQNNIIMFPAGICSRRRNGVIKDLDWRKTFITKSIETRRDVIPLHFEGQNSNWFYNMANVCEHLKLKFNVAMLFLVDEMMKNRHQTFKLTIGKPIPWETFDKSKTPYDWAQYVKEVVYKL